LFLSAVFRGVTMNRSRAVAYVREHGAPAELARLAFILRREPPSRRAVDLLLAGQRPDGGWPPFWAPGHSSLDATCYRLAQAGGLGLTSSRRRIERALDFVAARQQPDGHWEEDGGLREVAPPWARPGELKATLYLTANCAFSLATLGRNDDAAGRAAAYLHGHLEQRGRLPSFLQAHWLAAALWLRLDHQGPASRTLEYLDGRLDELPASSLAWMIVALQPAGLPASHPLLARASGRLAALQAPDGHWPSEDGPGREVAVTLDALRALRLTGPQ
jgi:hypothetical protein